MALTSFALAGGKAADAAIINQLDSSSFTYKYEMNAEPSDHPTVNLDGNAAGDFGKFTNTSGGTAGTAVANSTSGIVTLTSFSASQVGDGSQASNIFYNSAITGQLWPDQNFDGSFTLEARLRIVSQVANAEGVFVIQPSGNTSNVDGLLVVRAAGQKYGANTISGTSLDLVIGGATDNNTDTFHTFRMAFDASVGKFSVWRDKVLLADTTTSTTFGDAYTSLDLNRLLIGDQATTIGGMAELDYLRFISGAYAPVPEPASASLLLFGLGGLLARRRRA